MTYAFSFVFPFLLLMAAGQLVLKLAGQPEGGILRTAILALPAAIVLLIPMEGFPAGRWLVSYQANTSLPLVILLFGTVFEKAFKIRILDAKATLACRLFSVGAGLLLYPMALGIGTYDPYCAGWHFSWLFCLTLATTLILLIMKNRFSMVLLAAVLAYDFHLLESINLWDYLVDPLMVLVSIVGLIWRYLNPTPRENPAFQKGPLRRIRKTEQVS